MTATSGLQFARLHLPRPLDPDAVLATLGRLAADRQVSRLVFEVRAEGGRTRYLLGARPVDIARLNRLLGHFLPGCLLEDDPEQYPARPAVMGGGRLRVRPSYLPLNMETPEAVSKAVLSALAVSLTEGEALVVQVVLGPRVLPSVLPAEFPDCLCSIRKTGSHWFGTCAKRLPLKRNPKVSR